jgi:hypothetical protein
VHLYRLMRLLLHKTPTSFWNAYWIHMILKLKLLLLARIRSYSISTFVSTTLRKVSSRFNIRVINIYYQTMCFTVIRKLSKREMIWTVVRQGVVHRALWKYICTRRSKIHKIVTVVMCTTASSKIYTISTHGHHTELWIVILLRNIRRLNKIIIINLLF